MIVKQGVEFNLRFCVASICNSVLVYLFVDLSLAPGLSWIVMTFSWRKVFVMLIIACLDGSVAIAAFVGEARCSAEAPEVQLVWSSEVEFELTCVVDCDQIAEFVSRRSVNSVLQIRCC